MSAVGWLHTIGNVSVALAVVGGVLSMFAGLAAADEVIKPRTFGWALAAFLTALVLAVSLLTAADQIGKLR